MAAHLYRVSGRRVFQRLAMHEHGVQCVAANPRLDRFASGADDHLVVDWDLATPQPTRQWSGTYNLFVTAVAYSPDGSLVATGAGDGGLHVRDAKTGDITASDELGRSVRAARSLRGPGSAAYE